MSSLNELKIRTGFSAIKWPRDREEHRSGTLDRGKKLVEADHVKSVQEIQKPGKMTEIEGRCVRQTSVTEPSYYINLQLDDNRNIIRAFCQCIAGAVGICKHTAALIYFINNERDETKTDTACKFLAPSTHGQKMYPKGKEFDEIFGFKERAPRLTFKNISAEDKKYHHDLMKRHGQTKSPLYKICGLKVN
jgi:hypothetical protein